MYFDSKTDSLTEDIYSFIVFKKRKSIFKRTIRRNKLYIPRKNKKIRRHIKNTDLYQSYINDDRGIYSYVSWCPADEPYYEVWLCKIPKGSVVYSNSWEHLSNSIKFIRKL